MSIETVEQPQSLAEYKAERLNPPEPQKEEPKDEVAEEKTEEVKEDGAEKEKKPKNKLTERFSELTTQRNSERAAREAAEARAAELEAKLAEAEGRKSAPKVDNDIGPEPKMTDYTDAFEFAKDLAKWSTDKALKDRDFAEAKAKEEAQRGQVLKAWQTRISAAKHEIPDFDDITASSQAIFSDLVKETIIESEYGPQLLYHFAGDDDEADKLNKMSPKAALMYLAKLETRFEAKKEEAAEATAEVKAEKVERKRPPEPIKPIRTSSVATNPVTDNGEFTGSYQEWKDLRQKGR